MADYSPTWDEIASAWTDALKQVAGIGTVYYPYPESAVDQLELACVIINEPQNLTYAPFTHGAFSIAYAGEISLLVKEVETGQARLTRQDIAEITAFGLTFMIAVHRIRQLKKYATQITLGQGQIARFSPFDPDNRGHYAGLNLPYTVTMQYRS